MPFHAHEYACATSRTVLSLNSRCHPDPDPDPLPRPQPCRFPTSLFPLSSGPTPRPSACCASPLRSRSRVALRRRRLISYPPHLARTSISDVDGTLSLARQSAKPNMLETLAKLRKECAIAFVGGSDLVKIVGSSLPRLEWLDRQRR